ncbi:MAG: protein translocase subunit SecDF, partial [Bacteroidota bacterium]
MQSKGIIKFFLVVMLLVTAAQYLFVLPTNAVEKDAQEYAEDKSAPVEGERERAEIYKAAVAEYLDSMSNKEIFKIPLLKSYTYQDLKSQQLAYGLDLKGGMSVVLQVDLREFIRALAQGNKDPDLDKALNAASQAQANAQDDYVALFADEWQKIRGEKKLATFFQRNDALREEGVNLNTSDAEMIRILRDRADDAVETTHELLKKRIDQLGVVQPNVSLDAERDLIIVELPGIDNPERARTLLRAAAKLEFYDVFQLSDPGANVLESLIAADKLLDNRHKAAAGLDTATVEEPEFRLDTIYAVDSLGNITDQIATVDTVPLEPTQEIGPLFS